MNKKSGNTICSAEIINNTNGFNQAFHPTRVKQKNKMTKRETGDTKTKGKIFTKKREMRF